MPSSSYWNQTEWNRTECNGMLWNGMECIGMEADHGQAPASGQAPQGDVQDPRELAAFVIGVNP